MTLFIRPCHKVESTGACLRGSSVSFSLTAAALAVSFATSAFAQEVAPDAVVTAARTQQLVTDALPSTTVISRAEIEAATASDVVSLLRTQVGVTVRPNGPAGMAAAISMRGGEARHTLVLIDGVPLSSLATGQAQLEQLPLAAIERIEVVRGNMSALYGSQATGGVVQIFTRNAKNGSSAQVHLAVGNRQQAQEAVQLFHGSDVWQLAAGASHDKQKTISAQAVSSGLDADKDGFTHQSANLSVRFTPTAAGEYGARFVQTQNQTDIDGWYTDSQSRLQQLSLYGNTQWSEGFSTRVTAARMWDKINSASAYETQRNNTQTSQLSVQGQYQTGVSEWLAGGSWVKQKLTSSIAYDQTARTTRSAWLGYNLNQNRHHLQVNGRFDDVRGVKGYRTGAVNYGFDLSSQWRMIAGYSNAFSLPTFDQLYYPGYSNPNLKAESGNYVQAGLQWATENAGMRSTYFETRYRNKIVNDDIPRNIARARATGVENHLWFGVDGWQVDAGVTYQLVRDRDTRELLIRHPKWLGNLAVSKSWGKWQAKADWLAQSRMADNVWVGWTQTRVAVAAHNVLNLGLAYQWQPELTLGLKVANVEDKRYEPIAGYNGTPRTVLFTLDYKPKW